MWNVCNSAGNFSRPISPERTPWGRQGGGGDDDDDDDDDDDGDDDDDDDDDRHLQHNEGGRHRLVELAESVWK